MRTVPARTQAFSVAEVVLAVSLVALVAAAAMALLNMNMHLSGAMDRRTAAVALCRNRVEQLKRCSFSELALFAETDVRLNSNGVADADGIYLRSTTIGSETHHTRAVAIVVRTEAVRKMPPIQVAVDTVLRDRSLSGN